MYEWHKYDPGILFKHLKPINPLRPFMPYESKYFDDRRYDPPRKATLKDILLAHEELMRHEKEIIYD